ncbi:biotin transporter BioY [Roseicitreum antarcticum]|uniref:Biotin transporter n=1 Tax=Roseicitreum antarcticum TaxID=564137 RepID=A0A1H3BIF3_9RHOB|nr:biotin transporter BioY [Roseicitreum antarcticum]SDX40839.1 biotin transport system substrate-specific component [Roseicitreum antarcticum]
MTRNQPLIQSLGGTDTLTRKIMMVLFGTLLLAVSAKINVPMFPVPMTLQTLTISLIGLTYGSRLAGVTLLAYLAQGAMGLPVFAGIGAGLPYMMGPTGGFLVGFVGMAWLTGYLVERGLDRGFVRLFIAAFVPALLLFVPGVAWLWAVAPLTLENALMAGALPFVPGAVVKAAVAALIVTGAWQSLRARKG